MNLDGVTIVAIMSKIALPTINVKIVLSTVWTSGYKTTKNHLIVFMLPFIFSLVANVLLISCIAYCHFQPHPYMIYRRIFECCYSFFSQRNRNRYRNIKTNSTAALGRQSLACTPRRTNRWNRQISAQNFEGNTIETVHLPSNFERPPIDRYRRQNSYPPFRHNADGASLIETTEESHRYTSQSEHPAEHIQNQDEGSGRTRRINPTLSTSATFLKQMYPIESQTTPSTHRDQRHELFSTVPLKTSASLKPTIPTVTEAATKDKTLNSEKHVGNEDSGRHDEFSKVENELEDNFNTSSQHNQQFQYVRKSTSMEVCASSSKHQLEEMKSHGQNSADSAYAEMRWRSAPYFTLNNSMQVNNDMFQFPASFVGPPAMQHQSNSDDGYETVFTGV